MTTITATETPGVERITLEGGVRQVQATKGSARVTARISPVELIECGAADIDSIGYLWGLWIAAEREARRWAKESLA